MKSPKIPKFSELPEEGVIANPVNLKEKTSVMQDADIEKAIEKAQDVIESMAGEYMVWVENDILRLDKAFDTLKAHPDEAEKYLKELFEITHDMKGQGGSFHYDLVTVIGESLCRFIEGQKSVNDLFLEVIKFHIDAIRIVISNKIQGNGGRIGNELLGSLQAVKAKAMASLEMPKIDPQEARQISASASLMLE